MPFFFIRTGRAGNKMYCKAKANKKAFRRHEEKI